MTAGLPFRQLVTEQRLDLSKLVAGRTADRQVQPVLLGSHGEKHRAPRQAGRNLLDLALALVPRAVERHVDVLRRQVRREHASTREVQRAVVEARQQLWPARRGARHFDAVEARSSRLAMRAPRSGILSYNFQLGNTGEQAIAIGWRVFVRRHVEVRQLRHPVTPLLRPRRNPSDSA
jgi:hypothetical protein